MSRSPEGNSPQPEKKIGKSVLSTLLGGFALALAGVLVADKVTNFFSHRKAN